MFVPAGALYASYSVVDIYGISVLQTNTASTSGGEDTHGNSSTCSYIDGSYD